MSDHPYKHLPERAFWRRAVAMPGIAADPVGALPAIDPGTRIATAGSCFAQNIARHLAASGYHFLVTEPAHPILPAEVAQAAGYGLFSARTGNIYTSLQLVQLFDRAYGDFVPDEAPWRTAGGGYADPFRPTIQPGGFAGLAEFEADRRHHLGAVRRMFETLDVFVFTLGLTEGWVSAVDGAAFPICPGVAAGTFDPTRHAFRNLRVQEVIEQLEGFRARLKRVNPAARIILTVSPVPLVATAVPGGHVLAQTIYSKSLLRVAAQELTDAHDDVFYFPSYEMLTGPQAGARDFADDLRTISEAGVARVMALFMHHAAGERAPPPPIATTPEKGVDVRRWVEVMCDEAALDPDNG
jgi:hypothetical protein